ncbi:SDR family oxidoreductase [Rhizorhabdus wittichii]|jgi:NAD(P)-dependent dehydrogenase (short-subunit alcohol dehydrogenase family)|uniref:Peroxisomal trans-2-enoyl-CoA reductase n=1 Tax=Rhizorhabdus wittichii TaxID=160791 RepID=A0A975D1A3_9SPHN|nr:SDR family oxidoreductase [Rhizorhabdus wittichii]ARR54506.1 short-chain dehydrogenase [Rhizorhabdus wittichii DC-6]QTH20976.1 SDR family oxidoreductase [Rhizorhabdus wittichii]
MDANSTQSAPGGHVRPDPNDPTRPKRGLTPDDLATHDTVFRPDLLAGHRILITGGGSGMGKAAAFLAARLGAEVAICGRNADKLAVTRDQIRAATGREVMTAAMTIRDPEACEALIAEIHDRMGGLDTVVNNAGGQFPQDAIDFSRKGWLAVIDTNLNGTWWMMQEAAKRWRETGAPGHIINIVANVERGMPQAAHTCAARAGVIYLSKTVATEWAPFDIRINCIGPGVIETEGFGVYPEEALVRFHKANPMKTRGNAWDVAEAIAYLASPAGRFVNGDLLVIDGGQAQWGVVWPGGMPDYFDESGAA